MPSTDVCVVLTTAPDLETATSLVEQLVEARHAACGTVFPGATSVYWWKGSIQRESEVVIILKTSLGAQAELLRRTKEIHPYDVPELIVLPVTGGDLAYLDWVLGETALDD